MRDTFRYGEALTSNVPAPSLDIGPLHSKHSPPKQIHGVEGFVFAFSIASRKTFKGVVEYYDTLIRLKRTSDLPMLLVGLKSDLHDEREVFFPYAFSLLLLFPPSSQPTRSSYLKLSSLPRTTT